MAGERQQSCAGIRERFRGGYRQSGCAADLLRPCGKVSAGAQAPAGRDHRDHAGRKCFSGGKRHSGPAPQGLFCDDGRLWQRLFFAEHAQGHQCGRHQAGHEAHRHEPAEPQQGRADRGIGGGYGPPPEPAHHRRGRGNAGTGLHAAGRRLPVYAGLLFLQAHAGGERRGSAGPAQQ